jgi:hypothetical protein
MALTMSAPGAVPSHLPAGPSAESAPRGYRGESLGHAGSAFDDMRAGDYILSHDGHYKAILHPNGEFAVYNQHDSHLLWTTNSGGRGTGPYRLTLTATGDVVVLDASDLRVFNLNTGFLGHAPFQLSLDNTGSLQLRSAEGVVWDNYDAPAAGGASFTADGERLRERVLAGEHHVHLWRPLW